MFSSGQSCSIGKTKLFEAGCFFGGAQSYCCPSPAPFSDCRWVTKTDSKGVDSDCANSVCASDEIEILRSSTGGGDTRCACESKSPGDATLSTDNLLDGRQQPACCKIKSAPAEPAICSADLCQIPGLCSTSGSASEKRDLTLSSSTERHALQKRGQEGYWADIGQYRLWLIAAVVNSISHLYSGPSAATIIRQQYRLLPGPCVGPAIVIQQVGPGPTPPGLTGDATEHPLEVRTLSLYVSRGVSLGC